MRILSPFLLIMAAQVMGAGSSPATKATTSAVSDSALAVSRAVPTTTSTGFSPRTIFAMALLGLIGTTIVKATLYVIRHNKLPIMALKDRIAAPTHKKFFRDGIHPEVIL